MNALRLLTISITLLFTPSALAHLFDHWGSVTTNDTSGQSFAFRAGPGKILVKLEARTAPGIVTFDILGPDGALLGRQSAGTFTATNKQRADF